MLDRTPPNPHHPQPAPLLPQVNLLIWRENNFSRVCTQCFKISWNPKDFIKWLSFVNGFDLSQTLCHSCWIIKVNTRSSLLFSLPPLILFCLHPERTVAKCLSSFLPGVHIFNRSVFISARLLTLYPFLSNHSLKTGSHRTLILGCP